MASTVVAPETVVFYDVTTTNKFVLVPFYYSVPLVNTTRYPTSDGCSAYEIYEIKNRGLVGVG